MTIQEIKKWFEENYLDGDEIQEGQMLSSSFCFEAIKQALREQRIDVKGLILDEIKIAHKEGTPTSRLTSLFNKIYDRLH